MTLTALEWKMLGNRQYSNHDSSAIQSYSEAIKLAETVDQEQDIDNCSLYLLYSNRSAAYIQEKNFYSGFEDAKKSLSLKKDGNLKSFYRAAICAYHLGFIQQSNDFIDEATNNYNQNVSDYHGLKSSIEKKITCMEKWRKQKTTVKTSLQTLQNIIRKQVSIAEIPSILYHIRYLLRAHFEKTKDKKLLNMDAGDVGMRLHELAVKFNAVFTVHELMMVDPLFEDLILNELPDVGSLRIQAYEQRHQRTDNDEEFEKLFELEEKAESDLTAYEFSFFTNSLLASLVANCSDEQVSVRALKQIHRLTTNKLYRQSLGDAMSDACNNYIYRGNSENSMLIEKLVCNSGVEILFYDYIEASCQLSALRMIKQITCEQWKKQTSTTIQFVLKQLSKNIQNKDRELIEHKQPLKFELELKKLMGANGTDDDKEHLNFIVSVLAKIHLVFGQQPFIERSSIDAMYLYVSKTWFNQLNHNEGEQQTKLLLDGWRSTITQWIQLDYTNRQVYVKQTTENASDDDD